MSASPPPSRPLRSATAVTPAYPDLRGLRRLLAGAVPLLVGGPAFADVTVPVPAPTVSTAGAAVPATVREPVHLDGVLPPPRTATPAVDGQAPPSSVVHLRGKLAMPRPPLPGGPPAPRPPTVGGAAGSATIPGQRAPRVAPRPVPMLPGQAPAVSPKPAPVTAPPRQALRLHFHEPWEPCLTIVLDDEQGEAIS